MKGAIQQTEIINRVNLRPSPVREWLTARGSHLIAEKLDGASMNPIIMRLDDSQLVPINKLN